MAILQTNKTKSVKKAQKECTLATLEAKVRAGAIYGTYSKKEAKQWWKDFEKLQVLKAL